MTSSAGIIGAAVGCGSALLIVLAFIIFRHKLKRNETSCWGLFRRSADKDQFGSNQSVLSSTLQKSPTSTSSAWSSSVSKKNLGQLKATPIQPEASSVSSGFGTDAHCLTPNQKLFPLDYNRKLSCSTGYSSHSSDTNRSSNENPLEIKLHYRMYYDLDNAQLILHILEAQFCKKTADGESVCSSPERQKYRDTYVTFHLSTSNGDRRFGQTKIARVNATAVTNYGEIFALQANFETLRDQRIHFDVLFYNNFSRPQSLGSLSVPLQAHPLDNTDVWIDLSSSSSPVEHNTKDSISGPRPEILVFLSFHIPRDELQVDIIKAKNLAGLFPVFSQEDSELYLKVCLILGDVKNKQRSSSRDFSQSANSTIAWNESFAFPVTYAQLDHCVLLIYIIQRTKAKKEKIAGKCTVGPFGGSANAGYLQWQQQANSQIIRSIAMWHPVHRYHDGKDR
ncbi:synaptotagmin-7-like [Paramacrobiotus metropolitanus]|uniref:synaptotagmin-7-like n=1 Tax=Paramacrobiotus metropolitanus TaxID=2943436 RepID=UPI00244609CB|nr:synaptotagmin-7-like [Paramacrobiotus metropolitanus]